MTDHVDSFKHPIRDKSNRHIVDRLADVRDRLKLFKGLEEDLKNIICHEMGAADSLGGDEYIAKQSITERAGSVDIKAMADDGIDVEKYRKPKTTAVTIRLEKRVMDEGA